MTKFMPWKWYLTFSREEDINIEAWKKKNVEWLQKKPLIKLVMEETTLQV